LPHCEELAPKNEESSLENQDYSCFARSVYANVNGLPPAFVANAQFDGYRDEGQVYAQKLKDAGIPTIAKVYPGVIHDFLLMAGKLDASKTLIDDAASALRKAFNTTRAMVLY
jgi:acetyl esterase